MPTIRGARGLVRRGRGEFTQPTAATVPNPFFAYTTGLVSGAAIAANGVATSTISVQAGHNFVWRYLTAQYDQNDWSFRMTLTGLGAQVFDQDIRGALLFGGTAAGTPAWDRGMRINPPMVIPANTSVVITVTNGPTGNLNLYLALIGNRVGKLA